MPYVIREAQAALAGDQAVVIGLQSTGEAAADAMGLEPGKVCGFLSTTREMLHRFVTNHFPTQYEANTGDGAHGSLGSVSACHWQCSCMPAHHWAQHGRNAACGVCTRDSPACQAAC